MKRREALSGLMGTKTEQPTRPRPGRPPVKDEDKVEAMGFTLKPFLADAIRKFAKDNGTSMSAVVSMAIRQFVPDEYFK